MPGIMSSEDSVRTVAQLLSDVADAFADRLKAEAPNLSQGEIVARLQEDQRLRSLANQLYFEASDMALADAVDDEQALSRTLAQAKSKLAQIKRWQDALELLADVLVLAGALAAGKPGPILSSLKEVRSDLSKA
jgi:hypothetical protein